MTDLQELLCKEFCGALTVRKVPSGYALGTGYVDEDGDAIGFYVVGPDNDGKFRIEDDGLSIVSIEANGIDLSSKTRSEAFNSLLREYNVLFDEENGELTTNPLSEAELASASMRFLAFLLRVQDLLLLSQERVASTFKEDAMRLLAERIQGKADIDQDSYVHEELKDCPVDVVIRAPNRLPVALYFANSDLKVMEALLLQSYAENKNIDCSVVALLETTHGITKEKQQRAFNHLDAVPVFRGGEEDAIARIVKEATGERPHFH